MHSRCDPYLPYLHFTNPNPTITHSEFYFFSELDSLATNSIMLPIRGGSLLLGTGQRVILHRSPQRGADAVHYTDDSDGIRAAAPLRLSLTWCGIKMEAQKKHAFKAPR